MRQIWQISSFVTIAILAFAFQLPAQSAKQAETTAPAAQTVPIAKTSSAAPAEKSGATTVAAEPASATASAKTASGTVSATPAPAAYSMTSAKRAMKAKSLAMPLFFEANKGQADPSVRFLTRSKGYTLFVTPTETVLAGAPPRLNNDPKSGIGAMPSGIPGQGKAPVVRMQLAGANASPTVSGVDELHGKVNYLIGNDSSKWATNVPLYSKVSVAGVYPGVDLLFHGNERQLEYDFVVAPGADPGQIAFRIRGAKHIEIDANGNLDLRAGDSEFQMAKPAAYQEVAHVRRPVEGSFVRKGRNEIAFRVGDYDRSQALVIDPGIGYATFLGGAGQDESENLEVDNSVPGAPKLYFLGYTVDTTTFPEPEHTLIGSSGGAAYTFVAKIDPTITSDPGGTASFDYLTFIGGSVLLPGNTNPGCFSLAEHLSLDESQGSSEVEPVIAGITTCGDYPGTPTQTVEGVETTFVTRLTNIGSGIDASIILGGNAANVNEFVTVDGAGNVTATGVTQSTNLPVSSNAYVSQLNNGGTGAGDCYFMLLAREDLALTYATYLNVGNGTTGGVSGTQSQIGCGGIKDPSGKIDLGGATFSPIAFNLGVGGASIANGFETTFPAGATKATFALQIDPTASGTAALTYGTYFGGGGNTNLQTGAVNLGNGLVALVGWTESNSSLGDIPLKNAYQTTNNGTGGNQQTGFVAILDATKTGSSSLVFSSYFGGSSGVDQVNAVAYDANDSTAYRLILGGQTQSSDFPNVNSLQTLQGTQNAFVTEMKVPLEGQSGNASLDYSTLIGGGAIQATEGDKVTGVGVDLQDNVYAAGRTVSANFFANTNPTTTVNGFQTTCSSCSPTAAIEPDTVVFSLGLGSGATLQSLVVSPASATVQVGKTVQLTAQGYYSDGSIQELTNSVSWSTGNAGIASVSEGLVTGNAVGGPVTVTAVDGTVSGTASVTVTTATSYALTVTTSGTGSGVETSTPAGISCPPTCSAEFAVGQQVTLSATANGGSNFTGWSGATCSGTGTCVVTMNSLVTVNAAYTGVPSYELLLTLNSAGASTVTSSPAGINCSSTCSANFNPGTQVTLTETPATGTTFAGWGGACGGTGTTCTVTMNSMEDISASFNAVTFPATVATSGAGTGTVTSQPSGISCPPTCSANFNNGSTTILTANAAAGSAFAGWAGACGGTNGTCQLTMTSAQSATATFIPTTNLTLNVVLSGPAYGSVSGPSGLSCVDTLGVTTGTCSLTYPSGTQISLGETPSSGSVFGSWTGGGCSTGNTCAFTLTANTTVTATFNNGTAQYAFSLQPATGMTGSGTVTAPVDGINCTLAPAGVSGACSGTFLSGAIISLSSAPAAGSTFTGWSGGGCFGTTQPCTTVMSAAQTVTVTYTAAATYSVTIDESGTGTGTVTSSPVGISCPGTCTANFPQGTQLTLSEAPGTGSTFTSWLGQGCVGNNPSCFVTVTSASTIVTTFTATSTFGLTVTEAGTGSGTVSSNPGGITCPSTCSANFNGGAVVTLTATPNSGSTFTGWTGNVECSGTSFCTIDMNAAESVTATFNATQFGLTVTTTGGGTGTVTSSPAGINCGTTCTALFNSGTAVTLTATAATGSTFSGWTGAGCTGTGTCVVTMSAAEVVNARFDVSTFALTVTEAGTGTGTVSSNPAGITCPSTCSANYTSGTVVTLTPAAGTGSAFAGWSGACSGTGTCVVTMNAAEAVTATFSTATGFALTVTDAGTGSGTVTSNPSGISCATGSTTGCTANFNSGASVTLMATPAAGSTFAGWSGGCSGTVNCVVTMSAAQNATATFNTSTANDLRAGLVAFTNGTAAATVIWNPAFPDTNYTAVCTAEATPSDYELPIITLRNPGSMTVVPTDASGSVTDVLDCIAIPDSDTSDIRHGRVAFTDQPATVAVNWSPVFPDTNYTVACTVETQEGIGGGFTGVISSVTASGVQVDNGQITAGTMHCIAVPDTDTSTVRHARTSFGEMPATVTSTWNDTFPDANYAAACSDEEDGVTSSDAAIAISEGAKLAASVTTLDEVYSGTVHCLAVATAATTQYALTVSPSGTGSGTVTSSPAGISCPSTCSANFSSGSQVVLTASAGSESTFAGWSGNPACSGTGTCTITVSAAESVTATFNTTATFGLTVTVAGPGTGTVTSQAGLSPAINCSSGSTSGCTANYPSGTQVTLTATAANGSTFAGWAGQSCGGNTCGFVMNSAQSVTATFNATQFPLTVSLAGTGNGSVVSVPQGINCASACSAEFDSGTQVSLTATAGSGSSFFGWSGGGCSGTGTCVVTMNAAVNVTATFNAGANFVLTTSGGTATTVTTNPGGNIVVGLVVSGPVKETINLGCTSNAPQYLSCTITPTTVSLTGNGPTQVAIVLTSYCQGATPVAEPADNGRPRGPMPGIPQLPAAVAVLCFGMLAASMIWVGGGRRRWALTMAAMLLLAAAGMACGGLPKGPNGVTPAGNYVLTVTATAQGQAPQAVQINVQVN